MTRTLVAASILALGFGIGLGLAGCDDGRLKILGDSTEACGTTPIDEGGTAPGLPCSQGADCEAACCDCKAGQGPSTVVAFCTPDGTCATAVEACTELARRGELCASPTE